MPTAYIPGGAHIVHDVIDDEVMMINLDSGNYYTMNETGAFIWSLIQQQITADQILTLIAQQFSASGKEIEVGVKAFLHHLCQEGLAKEVGGLSSSSVTVSAVKTTSYTTPELLVFTDMQDLLLLDPIHETNEQGWPHAAPVNMKDQKTAKG